MMIDKRKYDIRDMLMKHFENLVRIDLDGDNLFVDKLLSNEGELFKFSMEVIYQGKCIGIRHVQIVDESSGDVLKYIDLSKEKSDDIL